jgi:hypothetical protein
MAGSPRGVALARGLKRPRPTGTLSGPIVMPYLGPYAALEQMEDEGAAEL